MRCHQVIGPAERSPRALSTNVPMRDGVRLATDAFIPGDQLQRTEAILIRTPYDMTSKYASMIRSADFFNEAGYVYVTQDCRGKFRSEGETEPYVSDVRDTYDTVEWITSQSWSNGVVGLIGPSYLGYTVWAGVASGHPAIRAAIPQATMLEIENMHVGGEWQLTPPTLAGLHDLIQIWTDHNSYVVDLAYGEPVPDMVSDAEAHLGKSVGVHRLLEQAAHPTWLNPYGSGHPMSTTRIPILHWVEWFDPLFAAHGINDYKGFRRKGGSSADLHFLTAHAADHGGFLLSDVPRRPENDPNVNDAAYDARLRREVDEAVAFFDEHLRGRVQASRSRARWATGHGGVSTAADWLPGTRVERFYLNANDGHLGLTTRPTATPSTVSWEHDPSSPVPSAVSLDDIWIFLEQYPDMSALRQRDDVLVFESAPLESDWLLQGEVSFFVELTSTAPSTHVFVKLLDVAASGTDSPVSRGEVVVHERSYRRIVRVPVQDTSYLFRSGHRFAVQITSSDYPEFVPHPGTDGNPWLARTTRKSTQSIVCGGGSSAFVEVRCVDHASMGAMAQ